MIMQEPNPQRFDKTRRTLFGVLSHNLFGAEFIPEPDVDWESVYREGNYQAVQLQAFVHSHELPLSPKLFTAIKPILRSVMLRDACVQSMHTLIHKVLTEAEIPYCVLKGAASARYYPNPIMRAMGDVDFYVHPRDLNRAKQTLLDAGFTIRTEVHPAHIVLYRDKVQFEMHFVPAGVPEGAVGKTIEGYLDTILEDASLCHNELATFRDPSPFHHGLIMLMHLQHHLLAEGIGLRHLCDWAVFVHSFKQNEFPALFEEKLREVGLWRFARLLSLAASLYVGLPEQDWMRETPNDEALAADLMEDIMAGGNFGVKDKQRAVEGAFISNRGKDGVNGNRMVEGIKALNRVVRSHWPKAGKCPLVLPVGWVYFLIRHKIRSRRLDRDGKPVSTISAYRKSAVRKRFYAKLGIYQPDRAPR